MQQKHICIVTGSRAEYGLLRWVMEEILHAPELVLQVIVTGMHLSPEFGLTYREIEADGFVIDRKVEMLLSSDTPVGISKSMGLGIIGFADALEELKPDLLLVLGDRYEIFAAASAALIARIPIAHLHGGEATEGAVDEALRHAITKMAHLHFVAAEEYQRRVIQLGEHPERVYLVGGLGVDAITRLNLLDRTALEESLDFHFGKRNLLVTYHPVTLENNTATAQMRELLKALECLSDTHIFFTLPNADTEGRELVAEIREFVERHPETSRVYTSLGQLRYFSCIAQVDGVIGNSSSGLLEVPSFRKGTVNIGDRQAGRAKAESVIDCPPNADAILVAIEKLYSPKFQETLKTVVNPYGTGGASKKIAEVLKTVRLEGLLKKKFYDLSEN